MGELSQAEIKTDNQLIRYYQDLHEEEVYFDIDPIGLNKNSRYIATPSEIPDHVLKFMQWELEDREMTKSELHEYWINELPKKYIHGFYLTFYTN